jgi:hypothetical protein
MYIQHRCCAESLLYFAAVPVAPLDLVRLTLPDALKLNARSYLAAPWASAKFSFSDLRYCARIVAERATGRFCRRAMMPPGAAPATTPTWKRGIPAPSLAVAASKVFDLKLPSLDEAAAG